MPEPIPAEPLWWRARDRESSLWHREPHDDGNDWRVQGGTATWTWAELVASPWGPFTCADGEMVTRG